MLNQREVDRAESNISDSIKFYERRIQLFIEELNALGINVRQDQNGYYQTDFDPNKFDSAQERLATTLKIKIVNDLRHRVRQIEKGE